MVGRATRNKRPRLRYLYFTFLMSMFRRRRFECTGWKSDLTRFADGKLWASQGNWIRGSSIRETNLEAFMDTDNLPLDQRMTDKQDDDLVADEIMESYQERVLGPIHEEESEDEEEGSDMEEEWDDEEK